MRMRLVVGSTLATIALATGCGGGGDSGGTTNPPPPPPPAGGFTVSASPATLSLAPNGSGTFTVSITRSGSFTGAVNLTATGAPGGVTLAFAPAQITAGAASSVVTVTVGVSANAGTSSMTITGTGTGASAQSTTLQLTVTSPPAQAGPFTLSMSATSYLVHPTNILFTSPIVTITRNTGFTGSVSFSVSGLPTTLFLGFTPSSTTGATTTAVVVNTGGTPNGTYTATIRGSSAQGDQTITLQVVVASPTVGAIKWKYCSTMGPRVFFAYRDGNGPWTRVMPSGVDTSYSFNLASGAGQVAEVNHEGGKFRTTIHSFTAAELATRGVANCALSPNVSSRTVNGSFGGVTGSNVSIVGMGWWFGSANGNGAFTLRNLPPGPLDAVAVRGGNMVQSDRVIIRRGINPASGSTLPVLDFGAAESFAPSTATWTFANAIGESIGVTQTFHTFGGTTGHFGVLTGLDSGAVQRTLYGVPLAQTVQGDLHQVVATISTLGTPLGGPARATRQVVAYARTLSDRTVTFGPPLPEPSVQPAQGLPAGRLRFQGTLPNEYNTGITLDVTQAASANHVTIHASRGFLGSGNAYDLTLPDLTGAIGWDTQFALRPNSQVQWWASGGGAALDYTDGRYQFNSYRSRWTGIMTGIVPPADGATYYFARATGTATP